MNRTEHNLLMCFDKDYAEKYVILAKERKNILSLYAYVLKSPFVIGLYVFALVPISLVTGPIAAILILLMTHTASWAIVCIPGYVKLKKQLGI